MYNEPVSYRSEVIAALKILGGQGRRKDICDIIEGRNLLPNIHKNTEWREQVSNELQMHSSDSGSYKGAKDIYYSVKGIKKGIWGIRESEEEIKGNEYSFIKNGEFTLNEVKEGFQKQILVNKFERSIKLRNNCIEKFGCDCIACKFNFEKNYGQRGFEFIEVHHLVPLSIIKKEYIATADDLRPVCSNCHSMIHRFKPFLTINEITDIVEIYKNYAG